MITRYYDLKTQYNEGLNAGAEAIASGQLVIFPTETVYGIGADSENLEAVRNIYIVKGRPSNNPLIVHIADFSDVDRIAMDIPDKARKMMDAFWPGPFTIVLKSRGVLSREIAGGLDTLAIRMPSNEYARELIKRSGKMIVAPSANISGRPSATSARVCMEDFEGKVPVILDGGESRIGLESTVCSFTGEHPVLLRPGGITLEMLRSIEPSTSVSRAVLSQIAPGERPESPGMLYKHYSPRAAVKVVRGEEDKVENNIKSLYHEELGKGFRPVIYCPSFNASRYEGLSVRETGEDLNETAHNLFEMLREADREGVDLVLFEGVREDGLGLAISNRIFRAAGFDIIDA